MAKPTKEDAEMILKLVEMIYSNEDLKKGMWWFLAEPSAKYNEFKKKYPVGSEGYRNFMNMGMFYELLGVLVYYGVLNEDLVFDLFAPMWSKAEPIVKGMQKEQSRDFLENYEWLSLKKAEWLKTRPPKFPEEK